MERISEILYTYYKGGVPRESIHVNNEEVKYYDFDEQKRKLKVHKKLKISKEDFKLKEIEKLYKQLYKRIKDYPFGYDISVQHKKLHIHIFKNFKFGNKLFEFLINFKDKKHAEDEYEKVIKIIDKKRGAK